jgi:uncharacterized protein (TIGR04255 family)
MITFVPDRSNNHTVNYKNKHLVEVNCLFQFNEETVTWDSTFFGQFYEKIKLRGYNQKEERKGVQIRFSGDLENVNSLPFTTHPVEDQVIFRNVDEGKAIMLGKNQISFHNLENYKGWEYFVSNVVKPGYEIFKQLGLGNGNRNCSIVYLNRFNKSNEEELCNYFTIVSKLQPDFGEEKLCGVQRIVSNGRNMLIAKLNATTGLSGTKDILLECGSVCIDSELIGTEDWELQANQTHAPIYNFFDSLITSKLKHEL